MEREVDMISRDYEFLYHEQKRINEGLNARLAVLEKQYSDVEEDWDNATLMRRWNIVKRTAYEYREIGLEYYKIGGRVYYTYEAREAFKRRFGKKLKIGKIHN